MADLKLAAQAAIYGALNGAAVVTDLGPVFEYVPQDEEPPFTIVDRMSATPQGGKDGAFDLIEFDILTVVREPGREFLTPLMAAVRDTIEGATLVSAAAILSPPEFVGDEDELLEDGQTYLGRQRFSLFAQPAD